MAKKAYIGIQNFTPRNLPDGYTQIEYIETSGTQYIDTGFYPNQNTRVVMQYQLTQTNSNWQGIMSCRDGSSDSFGNNFSLWATADGQYRTDFGPDEGPMFGTQDTEKHTVDKNKQTTTIGSMSATNDATTFSCNYPLHLATGYSGGTAEYSANIKIYDCKIYDNGSLVRDFVPCKNSSGIIGLYDLIGGNFYTNAGTGTFTAGLEYGSYARNIKKMYVGVNGIARKIKKAYVGVGGVARMWWSGGQLGYYGATTLSAGRKWISATAVGNYAIFSGGEYNATTTVDAYNKSLTRITPTSSSYSGSRSAATTIGDYAIFGGRGVDAYNSSLTKSNPTGFGTITSDLAAASIGNYALFGGGCSGTTTLDKVYAYDTSLTKSTPTALVETREKLAAASNSKYAIFSSGARNYSGTLQVTSYIDAYDSSLTKVFPSRPSKSSGWYQAGTSASDYAIFGGGTSEGNYVYAYDASLTLTIPDTLANSGSELKATAIEDYAIFGCGNIKTPQTQITAYNGELTKIILTGFSIKRIRYGAATIGNYAIFAGGETDGSIDGLDTVDVYTI